jgi:hypothetical protein
MSVLLDIWDQTALTEFVRRRHEDIRRQAGGEEDFRFTGEEILPLTSHNGRKAKLQVQDVLPTGLAQFKAPGATPALWTKQPNLREEVIELIDIDEFHRVDPIEMLALESPDPDVQAETAWNLADRGADLADRNSLRTEWMRWQALSGTLTAEFPNAGSMTIDYGIPVSHFPTFATPWTDVEDADPIEDLWALGAVSLPTAGVYLPLYHMNSATYRYLRRNEKIKDALSSYGRNVFLPTDSDLRDLLREGTQWKIVDAGYIPENNDDFELTKWVADGQILATTSNYQYAGRRIGEVLDGWVLVGDPNGREMPVARQGEQSEMIYHRQGQQTLMRYASARVPRLVAPNAIAWGTAYTLD